jgi:hypothetical protein
LARDRPLVAEETESGGSVAGGIQSRPAGVGFAAGAGETAAARGGGALGALGDAGRAGGDGRCSAGRAGAGRGAGGALAFGFAGAAPWATNTCLHAGQRTFLPATSAGKFKAR